MKAPFADGTPPLLDAWEALNPGVPHPSTFKHLLKMEPGGPELHCDFIFVSADLVRACSRFASTATRRRRITSRSS